jgi:DNA polymerase-4
MSLRQAHALCPQAIFLPTDEIRHQELFAEVIHVLENFSPLIEVESLGCAYLDTTGVQQEQALAQDIVSHISEHTELTACLGTSSGKLFSRAAALSSKAEAPVIVPPGQESDFISPFPIDILPCHADIKTRLHSFGIRSVGQLRQFSAEALITQFGKEGKMICELSDGVDRLPLIAMNNPNTIAATVEFDSVKEVTDLQMLHSCHMALEGPLDKVRKSGKLCSAVSVKVAFPSDPSWEKKLPFKEATVSISVILNRLKVWLDNVDLPAPPTSIIISLVLVKEHGKSPRLWDEGRRIETNLNRLAKDLRSRFGFQPVKRIQAADAGAILPERRFRLTDLREEEQNGKTAG